MLRHRWWTQPANGIEVVTIGIENLGMRPGAGLRPPPALIYQASRERTPCGGEQYPARCGSEDLIQIGAVQHWRQRFVPQFQNLSQPADMALDHIVTEARVGQPSREQFELIAKRRRDIAPVVLREELLKHGDLHGRQRDGQDRPTPRLC